VHLITVAPHYGDTPVISLYGLAVFGFRLRWMAVMVKENDGRVTVMLPRLYPNDGQGSSSAMEKTGFRAPSFLARAIFRQ
jgi:hypothetical protein